MASAGQAHAHSSHPMHFSRPSGQRLSWCRPWNRGAVGSFSKGYCSVTTFLNIVRNVTPNPAIGSQNCSLIDLFSAIGRLPFGEGRGAERERLRGTADRTARRHRRDREATGGGLRDLRHLVRLGVLPEEEQQQEEHQ